MATEVRIYTVKPGKLDEFVSIFVAEIMPTSAKYGVRVHAAWRNDEANEFVWVRSYDDEQALSTYSNSPERALYSSRSHDCLEQTQVRMVESVIGPLPVANEAP